MSVVAICGLPGAGKTLFATYLARKHFKKTNFLRFFHKKVNNVYSNYPIKLSKKQFSKAISLWDINTQHSYDVNSCIFLDEVQLYFDSLDYKDFPKDIRNTFQLHRHFGISNIYILSQHPSRIVKQLRVLACEFYDILGYFKIPFTPWCLFRYNIYYNFDDFGKSTRVKKADVSYKFKKRICFMNYKKVFKSYNTCYMSSLVCDKEQYYSKEFNSKYLDLLQISNTFNIDNTGDVIDEPLNLDVNLDNVNVDDSLNNEYTSIWLE